MDEIFSATVNIQESDSIDPLNKEAVCLEPSSKTQKIDNEALKELKSSTTTSDERGLVEVNMKTAK